MSNEVAVSKRDLIVQIGDKLTSMIAEQAGAFPKDFKETRFIQNCMAVLADTNGIEKCKPMSVVRTLIKGAYLGLDFFRKECYAIPYGDQLNFQTDYKGDVKLAKKYGHGVVDIYAKLVQEGDDLVVGVIDGRQKVDFHPKQFNDGKIIGVFAVAVFEDGNLKVETMSKKDIDDVRSKYSKAQNSPAWQKSWGEMAKKTVLRRLCKMIDIEFDTQEAQKAYEEASDADVKKVEKQEVKSVDDPFKKEGVEEAQVIDAPEQFKSIDPILFDEFKKKFPGEDAWQTEARVKEKLGVE